MTELQDDLERIARYRRIVHMDQPVRLLAFTEQGCAGCQQTRLVAQALAATFPQVKLELLDAVEDAALLARYDIDLLPAIALLTGGVEIRDTGIRFSGPLTGAEIDALLNDIVAVSFREPALEPATRAWLATLRHPLQLHVFVSPADRSSAAAVALAHRVALASRLVRADAINVLALPALAERQHGMSLPCIVVNDTIIVHGALRERSLLRAMQEAATEALTATARRGAPWRANASVDKAIARVQPGARARVERG